MVGVWERIIRSVRKISRVLLKQQLVLERHALPTLMAGVEGILSGRPLTLKSGMQSYCFRIFDC